MDVGPAKIIKPRAFEYDWPIVIVYVIILLVLVGVSVIICVLFCDRTDEEEVTVMMDPKEAQQMRE